MFVDGTLTFREFVLREPLPLARIQEAVLEFLRGRDDAVLFGAQAVNAYVDEPRMTQVIDILSPRAAELAEELRDYLHRQLRIAVRALRTAEGRAFRLFQIRKPKNRHLVDLRIVASMPPTRCVGGVMVLAPADLVAQKVIALRRRRGRPKSGTDWRDLAMLLLTFPDLKTESGPVSERLQAADAEPAVHAAWKKLVHQEIQREGEDDEF